MNPTSHNEPVEKHIISHVPVSELPPQWCQGLKPDAHVRVTIEEEEGRGLNALSDETSEHVRNLCEQWDGLPLEDFVGIAPGVYPTPEDAVNAIRKLRDEW